MGIKVLHLSSAPTWRGGEQQIIYLVEESLKKGIDSTIACKEGSVVESYCQHHSIPHISLPFNSGFDLKTALGIKRFCITNHISILHMHTAKAHTIGVIAGILGLKVPMVLARRVDFPINKNRLSRFKYHYSQIKKIICVSNKIKEIVQAEYDYPDNVVTIYSGVDLNKFQHSRGALRSQFPQIKQPIFVGNTSALADHKDYFTFVDTAEKLLKKRNDLHFFIIGSGHLEQAIRQYIQEKQLVDFITLTGFISNITAIIADLDVFLFTSRTEGLGTSVLDALAAEIPVVATNAGGVPEIIIHEKTGLLYPVGDSEGLAEGVERILNDSSLKNRLIHEGKTLVNKFDKTNMTNQTLSIYQSILYQE